MRYLLSIFVTLVSLQLSAQMEVDGVVLYGNEWIDYDKTYAKIVINEDGIYRVTKNELQDVGLPVDQFSMNQLEIWSYGKQIAFYVAEDDSYVEFYGVKNKAQLDQFLYRSAAEVLNPEYSLITDDATYFFTWSPEVNPLVMSSRQTDLSSNTLIPEPYYLVTVPVDNVIDTGDDAQVSVRFGGNNRHDAQEEHRTIIEIGDTEIDEVLTTQDSAHTFVYEVDLEELSSGQVKVSLTGTLTNSEGVINDKNHVSMATVKYPRAFVMDGADIRTIVMPASATARYIELVGGTPWILDLTNGTKILTEQIGQDKVGFIILASDQETVLQLPASDDAVKSPKEIALRNFIAYDDVMTDYILITSEMLRNQGSIDQALAYDEYRSSAIGGNYNTTVANVEQLYDQYAYGVPRHFIALKNYGAWALENYDDLGYIFILGKGLEYPTIRQDSNLAKIDDFYIPTYGNPGSDNLLLAEFNKAVPKVPIGRLSARNSADIKNYLKKVKDHDVAKTNPSTIDGRLWQKSVLHLSGGDSRIQDNLFNSLEIMRDTIENNKFGANVTTFRKKSTDPISDATSDLIFEQVENGLSLITFFGHASVGSFDFNLDNVENYNNLGRYPMLMSLGCYSGNIHTLEEGGISESFVLEEDKGAIGFMAASGSAYIGVQNQYGREFYSQAGGDQYGQPIGDVINAAMSQFTNFTDYSYQSFYQQLTFHGDPAVRLHNFPGPDYVPDARSVVTNPKFIDTYEESFEVCFDVINIGSAIEDSINVLIQHQDPKGAIATEVTERIVAPTNRFSTCVSIPITSRDLVGSNRLLITVDSDNEVNEQPSADAESNNELRDQSGQLGHEFFILNNSAVPTFPEEFAIVNTESVRLIANTFNALGDPQDFFVEIDTTRLFDSPLLRRRTVEDVRAVVSWDLDFELLNETVYYWRVGTMSEGEGGIAWRESSFVFEPGQRSGWSQEHYFQFIRNDFDNLEYVDSTRELKFVDNVKEIRMLNGAPFVEFYINGSQWDKWRKNITSGVTLTLFDPVLGNTPIFGNAANPALGSTSTNVTSGIVIVLEYPTETVEEREHLISVLNDSIPEDYVVAVNFVQRNGNRYNIDEWEADTLELGTSLIKVFEDAGATKLRELQEVGPVPYILVYENGNGKVVTEDYITDPNEQQEVVFQIKSLWDQGNVVTRKIGPAVSWSELVWNVDFSAKPENDSINIDVIGITGLDEEVVLFENLPLSSMDLSTIDAEEYPFLKLDLYSYDKRNLTTVQLDKMRVYYDPLGDLALDPDGFFQNSGPKLDEGQQLEIAMNISNYSSMDYEPVDISIQVINSDNIAQQYNSTIDALEAGASTRHTFSVDSKGLVGNNVVQMQLNSQRSPIEKYYFNNFGLAEFEVLPDTINPTLDVTFDGQQIMNLDIVSAEPMIRIVLEDDNKYLLQEDPSRFILSLSKEDGEIEQVSLDDPTINFIPAQTDGDNVAIIEYNPQFVDDGRYTLSVEAKDASGNTSGDLAYKVQFRVINEEMISNVFNYPNPFSTSTQFIFTLTGSETPSNVLIRILTLSGKVVREITAAELGGLKVGVNRTEYKWDGTDEFGERLANGTYLYQVITKRSDGSDYKKFTDETQNNTDYLFKEGFGKLVIMR